MESVTFVKGSGYGSRKKVKRGWGVVESKGERWATDESKFGHASLEKMGWDKTKGLGKGQQGVMRFFVRVGAPAGTHTCVNGVQA